MSTYAWLTAALDEVAPKPRQHRLRPYVVGTICGPEFWEWMTARMEEQFGLPHNDAPNVIIRRR